jgi:excinuclease UvrABC nuclease subunit
MSHKVVYRLFDEHDTLLYIGCTQNFSGRLHGHRTLGFTGDASADFYDLIHHWTVSEPLIEEEAERLECALIREEAPLYNRWRPHPVEMGPIASRWPSRAEAVA